MLPPIKGFLETSFVDWPGKVASVVFLPGCNFRCPYCHNHRLVLSPGDLAAWPAERVLDRLADFSGWIDGACITGGEPTLHTGLRELIEALRALNLAVKIDTNGSRPAVVRDLLSAGLLEAVSLDLKAPLEPLPYRRNAGTGSDPEAVAETLQVLADWGGSVEVRTTVHPDLLPLEELCRLADQAGSVLGLNARFTPQRCLPEDCLDPALRERHPLAPEAFSQWAQSARDAFREAQRRETPGLHAAG